MSLKLTDVDEARRTLTGPLHGALQVARGMCTDGDCLEEIDRKLAEADQLAYEAALRLGHGRVAPEDLSIAAGGLRPLLFSMDNPGGVLLEDLLEQLLREMAAKQEAEPCRETALVITHLETALLWQQRRGVNRGSARFVLDDPRAHLLDSTA